MHRLTALLFSIFFLAFASFSWAQETSVAFGSGQDNSEEPIEVTSENLAVDQEAGTALFTGEVIVGQGDLRLFAPRVLVIYSTDQSEIERMEARGGVTLISGDDEAEAQEADYFVKDGNMLLRNDVLMTQGPSAITSDNATINVDDGTALMTGNVKSIFQSNNSNN